MKPRSAHNKGYRLERYVCELINKHGFRVFRNVGSGSGDIKGDIVGVFPLALEVKNQKKLNIPAWIRQAKNKYGNWGVVFRNPETPESNPELFIIMDFRWFLKHLNEDINGDNLLDKN